MYINRGGMGASDEFESVSTTITVDQWNNLSSATKDAWKKKWGEIIVVDAARGQKTYIKGGYSTALTPQDTANVDVSGMYPRETQEIKKTGASNANTSGSGINWGFASDLLKNVFAPSPSSTGLYPSTEAGKLPSGVEQTILGLPAPVVIGAGVIAAVALVQPWKWFMPKPRLASRRWY